MKKRKKLLLAGLLLATTIVLSRLFSIRTNIITIGFAFVPIILSSVILGPKYSTLISTLADIIGALLFPTGPYFVGFTITSLLTGLVYGLILYRKEFKVDKKLLIRLIISVLIVVLLLNGVLNTIWIIYLYKKSYSIIITRAVKELIMLPIEVITMYSLFKVLEERIKKVIND